VRIGDLWDGRVTVFDCPLDDWRVRVGIRVIQPLDVGHMRQLEEMIERAVEEHEREKHGIH
jgi:hypothetical protein